jgi:multiple sugar transport system substrate-binding protein
MFIFPKKKNYYTHINHITVFNKKGRNVFMKKLQRLTAILLALLLATGIFAGCGAGKTAAEASPPAQVETEADAPEIPATEAPKAVEKEKIRFTFWDMTTNAKEFQTIVDEFNKQSTTVEVEAVDLSSTDYIDKLSVMLAAAEDIDGVVIKDLAQYSGHILKNQLAPLDELISKANFGLEPYGSNIDVLKQDGKIMALPYRSDFQILYYNKDIFDQAKEPYPTDDMTFDEFRAVAKKLTSGTGNDKIWGTYFHTWENSVADLITSTKKGDLISANFGFLKPAYELVLGMEQDDKSAMTYANAKISKAHYKAIFESGKVAMHIMGTWHIGQLIADKKAGTTNINWGIAKAPHWADSKSGITSGNLTPIAIVANSGKTSSAFEFLQFIAGEKGANILGSLGLMPGYRNQAVLDTIANVDGFPKENKSALETIDVAVQLLPHKNAAQMKKILGEENELMLTKEETIDEGLKKLDERCKDLAADNK